MPQSLLLFAKSSTPSVLQSLRKELGVSGDNRRHLHFVKANSASIPPLCPDELTQNTKVLLSEFNLLKK